MSNCYDPKALLISIGDRFSRLNKKVDILYRTARESFICDSGRETHIFNKNKLDPFLTKFEHGRDVQELYREWKQDLIIRYFDPRNYKNRV